MASFSTADCIVGFNLRRHRIAAGLTTEQLARVLGITRGQLEALERGETRASALLLLRLAELMECRVSAFFDGALDSDANG